MNISSQARDVVLELCERANLKQGSIFVVGCSTSEVAGDSIGKNSRPDLGNELFCAINSALSEKGIFLAAQCCEHLNRAIVVERKAISPFCETVNVVPMPKAGGSFATAAYNGFEDPVVVENIKADAGIDIGFTLIGMHLKAVAVPVRLENCKIGEATVIAARTRAKFIGGERANYNTNLL